MMVPAKDSKGNAQSPQTASPDSLLAAGKQTLSAEADALQTFANALDSSFADLCRAVIETTNTGARIVLMGVGKSGHIGAKIAATLASTGTPAQFIHPTEAAHGDLGAIGDEDLLLLLSKSGNSSELEALVPILRRRGNRLAAITCEAHSTLAEACDLKLLVPLEREACPINLAPTTSTTLMLALGDALATAVLEARGFSSADFAASHPGGRLGRQLLLRVGDLMRSGDALPLVDPATPISEALLTLSQKALGMAIIGKGERALGVLTDGDLRRSLERKLDLHSTGVETVMTQDFQHIDPKSLAVEAFNQMQEHRITALPVLAGSDLKGVITMHDIIRAGVV